MVPSEMNFVLVGLVLAAMAAVIRVGNWWQRFVALIICICPLMVVYDYCRWSLAELSSP
jgi:hypothetical protein